MKEITTTDIERVNLAVLVIGSLCVLFITKSFKPFCSFAVASGIMILNFRILKKILEAALMEGQTRKKALILVLPLKFLALAAAITVFFVYADINIWFFLLGLSTVFFAVIICQAYIFLSPAFKRRHNHGA